MKTPEQLKGAIRNIAEMRNLRPQEVLQMFLFERILERLSASRFQDNFILKGGLLISSMIKVNERTTIDMDTTVRGIQMEEHRVVAVMKEIISMDVGDGILFSYIRIEPIHDNDSYRNFRVHIEARYGKIKSPMKIDITTGDEITPAAIQYNYPLLFENKTISIMAYTLETILAEKYETIIHRNVGTTRARDFYDLHILFHERKPEIHSGLLRMAVKHTAQKRGSAAELEDWQEILQDIRNEPALKNLWSTYVSDNSYVGKLEFSEVTDTVEQIGRMLQK